MIQPHNRITTKLHQACASGKEQMGKTETSSNKKFEMLKHTTTRACWTSPDGWFLRRLVPHRQAMTDIPGQRMNPTLGTNNSCASAAPRIAARVWCYVATIDPHDCVDKVSRICFVHSTVPPPYPNHRGCHNVEIYQHGKMRNSLIASLACIFHVVDQTNDPRLLPVQMYPRFWWIEARVSILLS